MAFINRRMVQNKAIIKAWRAGHRQEINYDEETSLSEICAEIENWMRRNRRPRSRLSLRSFSVLLSGAIRLYRDQVDLLLKDTFSCSINPVSHFSNVGQSSESSGEEQDDFSSGTDTTSTKGNDCSEDGESCQSTEYNTDTESLPSDDSYEDDVDEDSTVFTATPNSKQQNHPEEQDATEKTRDQIIQTSPTRSDNLIDFDPTLPFGYMIVHDNYDSRIPSKILFSSLSENVNVNVFPAIN